MFVDFIKNIFEWYFGTSIKDPNTLDVNDRAKMRTRIVTTIDYIKEYFDRTRLLEYDYLTVQNECCLQTTYPIRIMLLGSVRYHELYTEGYLNKLSNYQIQYQISILNGILEQYLEQ